MRLLMSSPFQAKHPTAPQIENIRVLFVIDQLKLPFGGAEEILRDITSRLPNYGFSCRVMTFAMDPEAPALFTCPVQLLPMTSAFGPDAVRMATRFVRHLWRERPHIVHTMFESSDLWAGTLTKLTSRAALVSSRRDMGIQRNRMHDVAYRMLRRLPDRVITVSDQVRRFVIERDGISPERVATIYNGVAVSAPRRTRFDLRRELRIPPESPVVVTVGNIRRVKGFDILLRAAGLSLSCIPTAHFIIVGGVNEPDHMAELDELVRELGLAPRVHFAGYQTDIASYLAASDIFVLPSRSEGFSNALLQAMVAGLPCIATRVGGNAEAIDEEMSGYLVEPEDVAGLAERITFLANDKSLQSALAEFAQMQAGDRFSMEAMLQSFIDLYRKLPMPCRRSQTHRPLPQ